MDFAAYLVPLVIAKHTITGHVNNYALDRYAGMAFFVDGNARLATCKHIVEMVQEGEALLGLDLVSNEYGVLANIKCHPQFDFATAIFPAKPGYKVFPLTDERIDPGDDVIAMGMTSNGRTGTTLNVDARLFKGYVVRYSQKPAKPDARSTVELSFPSHKGFSGAPLIDKGASKLVGMLFSNMESSIEIHRLTEIDDAGKRFEENIYRIVELGLAHSSLDIRQFIKDLS